MANLAACMINESFVMRHSCNDGGACCVQDNGQPETPARFVVIDGAIVMC